LPRSAAVTIENNFVNGLVTEATALNFPEAAATDTYNCVFNQDGSFTRRLGVDFEPAYTELTLSRNNIATSTYYWRSAAGSGEFNFVVVQVGLTLRFYASDGLSLSAGLNASSVSLTSFLTSGVSVGTDPYPEQFECEFTSGKGYLFVSHPYMDPVYVAYNTGLGTFTATKITLKIRDLEGITDSNRIDLRPSTLTDTHKYNLYNQGWAPFETGGINDPRPTGSTTVLNSRLDLPTGYLAGDPLTTWDTNRSDFPSDADQWWLYKDAQDVFQPKLASVRTEGNSPAPKGHYILDAFNQNRTAAVASTVDTGAGNVSVAISGLTVVSAAQVRPKVIAFFAGRVWYAGVDALGFSNKLYFSQIVENTTNFGQCYQVNDPTAENQNDILPTDGGVIQILDMGSVIKLFPMQSTLLIFASNGVWSLTGSTGTGFKPTDFTISKVSSIPTVSAAPFVDVAGFPMWWTQDGIYMMNLDQMGAARLVSISEKKIKAFYENNIPALSRRYAKGYFNPITKVVHWCYRSSEPDTVERRYEYDRVLNFNTVTQAFYPWSFTGNVTLNGVIVIQGNTATTIVDDVTVSGTDVTVSSVVVTTTEYSETELAGLTKFLCSYVSGSSHKITFANEEDTDMRDFVSFDSVGVDYESYVVSGYKVRGDAQRRFQTNYVYLFADLEENEIFDFRSIWDYHTDNANKEFGSNQRIDTTTDTGRRYRFRRLKIRGSGISVQFKIASIPGRQFKIVGWSTFDTANAAV
jgi:hypothetical protein